MQSACRRTLPLYVKSNSNLKWCFSLLVSSFNISLLKVDVFPTFIWFKRHSLVLNLYYIYLCYIFFKKKLYICATHYYYFYLISYFLCAFQWPDSKRDRVSRSASTSKRAVISSSQPSSIAEPIEQQLNQTARLVLGSSRPSSAQRIHPGYESKSSLAHTSAARITRNEPLRSFELLSIGRERKKWI